MKTDDENIIFVIIEAIGAIFLLLIDPERFNTKKYLDVKYKKYNRITGFVVLSFVILVSLLMKVLNKW
jgi:hypothetical protein